MNRPYTISLLALVFFVTSVSAAASTTSELLDRWSRALGGEHAPDERSSTLVRTTTSEGGLGGSEVIRLASNGYSRVTEQHGDDMEEVCAGAICWLRDWNGHVRERQGRDLKGAITDAFLEGLLYRGRELTGVIAESAGEDESNHFDMLKLTPPGGLPVTIFLDKATGLPARAVRKEYDDDLTTEFQDWRVVGGKSAVPCRLIRTGGEDRPEKRTTVRSVTTESRRNPLRIARPVEKKDYRFASARSASGIPFLLEEAADHIMVQVSVNRTAPAWFLLDTGADVTIINKDRLVQFGLTAFGSSSVTGGGNSTDYSQTKVTSQKIGGVELLNQRVGVVSLKGLERLYGMPMGGLLGCDFLSRFVVKVNYDTKKIDLIDPARFVDAGTGDHITFVLEEGHPHVPGTIAPPEGSPIPAYLLIDSGAAETMNLAAPFVKQHHLLELARKAPTAQPNTVPGLEKEFFAQNNVRGRLASVTLGETTLTDLPVNLSVNTSGAYASTTFSATVGEGILKRFNTTYDYSRNLLILDRNAATGTPFQPRRTFGATLLAEGADFKIFRVAGIRKDSPAEAAGLRVGDVISGMDGRPAALLQLSELRKRLSEEGTVHTLEISRGGERIDLSVTVQTVSIED